MNVGDQLVVTFEAARSGGFTALSDGLRVFPDRAEPLTTRIELGQRWLVEAVYHIKDNLWRVRPIRLECSERRPAPRSSFNRHVGQQTPEHLVCALQQLPGEFEVVFEHHDSKGPFALYQGIAVRPLDEFRIEHNTRYLVRPRCSGARGIYVSKLERALREEGVRIPDSFEVTFNKQDEQGVFAEYQGFVVRPQPQRGEKAYYGWCGTVRTLKVLRRGEQLVYVQCLSR